jgi:hypothetical protein
MHVKLEDVKNALSLYVVIVVMICVLNVETMITSIVVAMVNVIVAEMMSIVVQKGGLVVNVKNGIVAIVDVATILARNVVLKKKKKTLKV